VILEEKTKKRLEAKRIYQTPSEGLKDGILRFKVTYQTIRSSFPLYSPKGAKERVGRRGSFIIPFLLFPGAKIKLLQMSCKKAFDVDLTLGMIPGDRIVKYRHGGRMRHRIGSGRRGQTSMKLKSTKGKEKTIHRKRGLTKADRVSYLGRPESVFSPRGEGSKNIERRSRKFSLSRGGQLGRRRPSDLNLTRGETGFFPCERPVSSVDRSCSCCALISSSVRP